AEESVLEDFDDARLRVEQAFAGDPFIIVGDFNCWLREFGPMANRPALRCAWLRRWLEEPGWQRVAPDAGRWTTQTFSGGHGVTDLLWCNVAARPLISSFVVHDTPGSPPAFSDHRMLTFELDLTGAPTSPPFERLNVRKLLARPQRLTKNLRRTREPVRDLLLELNGQLGTDEEVSLEARRTLVDQATERVTRWINGAAIMTAGRVRFRDGDGGPEVEEAHLEELKEKRDEAQAVAEEGGDEAYL
ncbi:hypothetical protein HK405_002246, partial [Cladochytrium tenue]